MTLVPMNLYIWPSDFKLPSIDTECLQIMCYSRFCGAPIRFDESNNMLSIFTSPPLLKHGSKTISKFDEIVEYLKTQNYNADLNLNPEKKTEILPYKYLIMEKLNIALAYLWWYDQENYKQLTHPWYSKRIPFYLRYFLLSRETKRVEKLLLSKFNEDYDPNSIKDIIIADAKECLTLLDEKLANNDFFFGNNPSSLDALIFGYIAPLFKINFPSSSVLQNHILSCKNLSCYVDRILNKYFPLLKEAKTTNKKQQTFGYQFPHSVRDTIIFTLFSASAMIIYAFYIGILLVTTIDPEESEDDDDAEFESPDNYDNKENQKE